MQIRWLKSIQHFQITPLNQAAQWLASLFVILSPFTYAASVETKADIDTHPFKYQYLNNNATALSASNPAFVVLGGAYNRTTLGSAGGVYLSGITPISDTPIGIYGRAEIIRDRYNTNDTQQSYWSWHLALGAGYYFFNSITPYITVGKCFSNQSTCYANERAPTQRDDVDAIYFGAGSYVKSPFSDGVFEFAFDWSSYKGYGSHAFYLGYGLKF